jgi:hypothetical protein
MHASDGTLVALWGGAMTLILLLLFMLSSGFRINIMGEKINDSLSEAGQGRAIIAPLSPWRMNGEAISLGSWWIIGKENNVDKSENYGVVLSVLQNGIFASFLGIALEDDSVELIPLTKSAQVISARLPANMLDVYKKRVASAAKKITERRSALASKRIL